MDRTSLTGSHAPSWRTHRGVLTGVAVAIAVASLGVAQPAAANYPPPPGGSVSSLAHLNEVAPSQCPSWAPAGSLRAGGSVYSLCTQAAAGATSREAAGAIRYAFRYLGAAYSQLRRDSVNPPVFDCSSMVGRAYRSAGARIINSRTGSSSSFYPLFGWTGAYVPSAYAGTNLVRVTRSELRPGDIIIQFNGRDPSQSAGNAGHAQLNLGNGRVIQSGGGSPSNVNVAWFGNYSFSNSWYFRLVSPGGSNPVVGGKATSQVTPWKYPSYSGRTGSARVMTLRVSPGNQRQLRLQYFNTRARAWATQSVKTTDATGRAKFALPMRKGRWAWRLAAPATGSATSAVGPKAIFIGL